jgi:hypothetical protein
MPVRSLFQSKWAFAFSALVVGSVMAPALGRIARPIFRRMVKGGIVAQQALTGVIAGLREDVEDIVAEAKAELASTPEPSHDSAPHHHGTA